MLFRNYTPFPPLQFESRDEQRNDFGVIVLRGTFQIENGRRLRLVQKQEPLIMADEYYGEPGQSSLKYESSIAPYKPKTDILINANAYSPSGKPEKQWTAGIQFGSIKKEIQVTGPRRWERGFAGWNRRLLIRSNRSQCDTKMRTVDRIAMAQNQSSAMKTT